MGGEASMTEEAACSDSFAVDLEVRMAEELEEHLESGHRCTPCSLSAGCSLRLPSPRVTSSLFPGEWQPVLAEASSAKRACKSNDVRAAPCAASPGEAPTGRCGMVRLLP
mmetsp:Transcript_45845/g.141908  ORF Transcript_45845/g.141908 Transcript_45845/m.141908 type:complete len:110 (-) Transcript_45845:36-365(-)